MEIRFEERKLDDVIEFYADGFNPKDKSVMDYEWFIDTNRKTVIFKLLLEDKEPK